MRRYRLAFALALTVLGSVSFSLWNGRIALFRIMQTVSDGFVVEARRGQPLAQSFIAYYPGMTEVAVQLADTALPAQELLVLRLAPQDAANTSEQPMQVQRRIQEVQDGVWLRFKFEPLDQSRGRHYVFSIEPTNMTPLKLLAHHANMYPEGELQGTQGDLVFQVGYNGRIGPTLSAFLERVSQRKPGVLGQPWFYAVLFGAYLLALVMTALVLAKRFLSPPQTDYED
jgi:hypothetical protein